MPSTPRRLLRLLRLCAAASASVLILVLGRSLALAADGGSGQAAAHSDPMAIVLLAAALVIALAVIGRGAAGRFDQPDVLGELLIGIVIGNIGYQFGLPVFAVIMHLHEAGALFHEVWTTGATVTEAATHLFGEAAARPETGIGLFVQAAEASDSAWLLVGLTLWLFSNIGIILLLFQVGLESSVREMRHVGGRALAVAVVGVVLPMVLGYGISAVLVPGAPASTHLFVGATLTATSVGITARVFSDLGRLQSREAQIILGAAVIDDVLGLIVLAVVVGIVTTGGLVLGEAVRIVVISLVFLGGVLILGPHVVRAGLPAFRALDRSRAKLLYPLALCFVLSWMASYIGLAAIVGAFAAGIIIEEAIFAEPDPGDQQTLADLVRPLEAVFAPVFFVVMGMQVNLRAFLDLHVLMLASALIVCAVGGKVVAGAVAGSDVDRATVGLGMVPRGEVGLIFANVGRGLGVMDEALFGAIVVMVVVTTLITPFTLRWSLARGRARTETP
ncbi:cation:proton antiporter [Marinivivus vitaminiproducens]|uniref:cation:proton antiporter n=1 Tax=Marinivivus vitaminiproducens TaxID=3035935 RepID=UPI00279BC56C|nr:cation:proton antiporter [Geminicoccaceae bacterium SCSIO 64248]